MSTKKTKNDTAWEKLFLDHHILFNIKQKGCFRIKSSDINKVRQSRLMAKFDHFKNLPAIFRKHNLSILPLSRSEYVIGPFNTHLEMKSPQDEKPRPVSLPGYIKSLEYGDIYSESSAVHCAHLSGMIDEILGGESFLTFSGRTTTGEFDFTVQNPQTDGEIGLEVRNSQCEIDAGFESRDAILILEAKNYEVDDFIIRQLYYPYRMWFEKMWSIKKIIPALLTYSNDVFTFHVFEFEDEKRYNSIRPVFTKKFILSPGEVRLADIVDIFCKTPAVDEPEIPFPQADRFERVMDLLGLLMKNELTKDEIASGYGFDPRQADYYTNAARYLGLVEKTGNENGETAYFINDEGREIMSLPRREKVLKITARILSHEPFRKVMKETLEPTTGFALPDFYHLPDLSTVTKILQSAGLYGVNPNSSTLKRRARTVRSWVGWILSGIS